MDHINTPKPEVREDRGVVHYLRMAASGLAFGASAFALLAQVVDHFRKPAAGPLERTKAGTALLGLAVLRTMPALIKNGRILAADLKRSNK